MVDIRRHIWDGTYLKGLIGAIATHVVRNRIVLVLPIAYEKNFLMIDVGIAALPVLAELQRGRRQGLRPALWAFWSTQIIVTQMSQLVLVKKMVLEEVCDVQSPLDVDLLAVGALEDRTF